MGEAKINFLNELDEQVKEDLNDLKIGTNDFYKLCRGFFCILLNSELVREGDKLGGLFKFVDVDNFIEVFKSYSFDNKLDKRIEEKLFDLVSINYLIASTEDEKRNLPSGFIKNSDTSTSRIIGHYGTYFNCNYIPNETIQIIKDKLLDN